MKPDPSYMKGLLGAFENYSEPSITIRELQRLGFPYEDKHFYFHVKLFHDQGFVVRDDNGPGLGIDVGADGRVEWSVLPLRLTASGYAFAEALNSHAGWEAVKKSGLSASLGIMKDLAIAAFKAELARHGHGGGF